MQNQSNLELSQLIIQLEELVDNLRDKQKGDPWILAQDFKSLALLTIEEAYEFADSIDHDDFIAMCDELGDILLHVFLYAKIASEKGQFNIHQIIQSALDKQTRRKLNFPTPNKISPEAALKLWEEKKAQEKSTQSIMDNIANAIPALLKAAKLQNKAAQVGFDWPEVEPIYNKISEELQEFKHAVSSKNFEHMQEELGDVLFSLVNLARHYKINPEAALRSANQKFEGRFRKLEAKVKNKFDNVSFEELDSLWNEIKKEQCHPQSE